MGAKTVYLAGEQKGGSDCAFLTTPAAPAPREFTRRGGRAFEPRFSIIHPRPRPGSRFWVSRTAFCSHTPHRGLAKNAKGTRKGLAFLPKSGPTRSTTSFHPLTCLNRTQNRLQQTLFFCPTPGISSLRLGASAAPRLHSSARNKATESDETKPKSALPLQNRHFCFKPAQL